MRRVFQKQITFQRGLGHKPELTGFQIFEATLDKPRRGSARAGTEIRLIYDETAYALLAHIPIKARAVDARAKDEHIHALGLNVSDAISLNN